MSGIETFEQEKIIVEVDGKEVEYEVLFTFESEDTKKAYVGYTDHSKNEKGKTQIYVSSYDPIYGTGELEDITDPKEVEMIQEVLKELQEYSINN